MPQQKGNVQPLFTLKVGAASAVDHGPELVSIEFTDGDGSPLTFADYAAGIAPTAINATFALNTDAGKAFDYHWTNAGTSAVAYAFQFSNATVSAANPKFSGTLTMPRTPLFSHEAGDATTQTTFDVTYQLDTYNKASS